MTGSSFVALRCLLAETTVTYARGLSRSFHFDWADRMSSKGPPNVEEWQRSAAATLPVEWKGDLDDDCTAEWAGLTLRAESMKRAAWWWAVYDDRSGETIGSSNDSLERFSSGKKARAAAERVATEWLTRG
jgi:hypothetical protein